MYLDVTARHRRCQPGSGLAVKTRDRSGPRPLKTRPASGIRVFQTPGKKPDQLTENRVFVSLKRLRCGSWKESWGLADQESGRVPGKNFSAHGFLRGASKIMDWQPEMLVLFIPHMLFALSLHEASHAYTAYRYGDDTAALLGRVTLNPIKHLDLFGTIAFFLIKFGWAKPVPVNPLRLKNPRRDELFISLAGPGSNLVTGFFLLGLILLVTHLAGDPGKAGRAAIAFFLVGAQLNIGLCFFNLIPVPPLDGSHVLMGLLPEGAARKLEPVFSQGVFLLIALVVLSSFLGVPVFEYLIWRPMFFIMKIVLGEKTFFEAFLYLKQFQGG